MVREKCALTLGGQVPWMVIDPGLLVRNGAQSDWKVGDLLRFKRGMYSHWAVYLGKYHLSDDKSAFILDSEAPDGM